MLMSIWLNIRDYTFGVQNAPQRQLSNSDRRLSGPLGPISCQSRVNNPGSELRPGRASDVASGRAVGCHARAACPAQESTPCDQDQPGSVPREAAGQASRLIYQPV